MKEERSGILVVEDQLLLAMDICMSVAGEGFETLGPCKSVDSALEVLLGETPKAAILDVNLGSGATSEPIAEELTRLKVPFAFLTAYSRDIPIMDKFPEALFASKPLNDREMKRLLEGLMGLAES